MSCGHDGGGGFCWYDIITDGTGHSDTGVAQKMISVRTPLTLNPAEIAILSAGRFTIPTLSDHRITAVIFNFTF